MMNRLPPDSTADEGTTNSDRATWAAIALRAFGQRTGTVHEEVGDADDSFLVLADLLADLAHWCDRNDVNLSSAIQHATWHYQAETSSEGKQLM